MITPKRTLKLSVLTLVLGSFMSVNSVEAQVSGALLNNPNFVFVSGNHAYVTSQVDQSLEIIDIADPARPAHRGAITNGTDGAALHSPTSVAVSGNYAYITSLFNNALEIIDISDPNNPTHVSTFSHGNGGAQLRCPTQVVVSGNYAYIAVSGCGNANPSYVEIVDISNPSSPLHASTYSAGSLALINSIFVSGDYLYITVRCLCSGPGSFAVIDVSNPSSPIQMSAIGDGTDGAALFTPLSITVSGGYAYIASLGATYSGAVEVIDVTDPTNIFHSGVIYDGEGGASLNAPIAIAVSGNYVYVTSYGSPTGGALEIIDISNPSTPTHEGTILADENDVALLYPASIFVSGNYAYIAALNSNALEIVDVSDPANPVHKGKLLDGELVGVPPIPIINPVIIIPGIMGSAYKNGELVIDPILHTYDDLIATLVANGYVEGEDLFTFPYEWRDSNVFTANLLDGKIEEVKSICDCGKVDVIAHSMGGLAARTYIQSVDYDEDIDQLIFLGTPHKGSPKAYLQWEAGEFEQDFDGIFTSLFFEAEALRNGYLTIFDYIHNRPILSVRELLPIFDYLKDSDTEIVREYPSNYPENSFLENINNNVSTLLNSGVDITNIVGNTGENETIERIRVVPINHPTLWEHGEPDGFRNLFGDKGLERGIGDNTVSIFGASLDDSIQNDISNASHRRIPTVEENKIYKILTGKDSTTNIDSGFNISPVVMLFQLKSPIDFLITDPNGNRIGKNFNTEEEYDEIPFAFYSGYQTDDEYITILNPLDGDYRIELQGTGNGEYEVLTSYISDEFATTTEVTGITTLNQVTNLEVEVDNNNPENLGSEREVTLDIMISDINGAYDLGWITDKKVRENLIKQAKLIIKLEKKRSGKYEKKVDKVLIKLLEKELDLLLKKGKIKQQGYDLLKTDLKYLINNG